MKKLAWIQQRGRKRTLKSIEAPVYKLDSGSINVNQRTLVFLACLKE